MSLRVGGRASSTKLIASSTGVDAVGAGSARDPTNLRYCRVNTLVRQMVTVLAEKLCETLGLAGSCRRKDRSRVGERDRGGGEGKG